MDACVKPEKKSLVLFDSALFLCCVQILQPLFRDGVAVFVAQRLALQLISAKRGGLCGTGPCRSICRHICIQV